MDRSSRSTLVAGVVVLVVIAAALIAVLSWYDHTTYVVSDYAQVTVPMAPVGSPVAGTLTAWSARVGESVSAGETLGTVTELVPASAAAAGRGRAASPLVPVAVPIAAPFAGTVVQTSAVVGETVEPGAPLAYVANLAAPSVVAYVSEKDIRNVKVGQTVDVHVDALPGTTITGTVASITLGTASAFSLLPTPPPSGSLTPETQYVPVTIALAAEQGQVLPGESAWVRIHIR